MNFIVPDFLKECSSAVIYARVSTQAQARNSSLQTQWEACRDFAHAARLPIAASYEEVESGALYAGRPQLQAALRDLESGRAQYFWWRHSTVCTAAGQSEKAF